jgi:hypothetical protein
MIGCILIALGTFIVASGGTLTRLGHREYLYIAMSVGIAVIFAGILETRRSDAEPRSLRALFGLPAAAPGGIIVPFQSTAATRNPRANDVQALEYIIDRLLPLDDAAIDRECHGWSVSRRPAIDSMTRAEARQVWELRTRLDPPSQHRFDLLAPATRLQLAELYVDVFRVSVDVDRTG